MTYKWNLTMIKNIQLFSMCALMAGLTCADVPNTFVNGQVANADEVNDNFSDLDGRVSSLEDAAGGSPAGGRTDYIRNKRNTNPGDTVTIGKLSYIVARFPIATFDGVRSYIQLPVAMGRSTNIRSYHGVLSTPPEHPTQSYDIDGYKALALHGAQTNVSINDMSNNGGSLQIESSGGDVASLLIAVGRANLFVEQSIDAGERRAGTISVQSNDMDYTNDGHDESLLETHSGVSMFHEYLDYISIDTY
jgi:hypothetical protein